MAKNSSDYFGILFIVTVTLLVFFELGLAASVSDESSIIREYAKQIIDQTDPKIKPCDSFKQYACGNTERRSRMNLIDLFERLLMKSELKTEAEKQAKKFYLSCKNKKDVYQALTQLKKFTDLGTIPVTKELSMKDIAKLLGQLSETSLVNLEFENTTYGNTKNLVIFGALHHTHIKSVIATLKLNDEDLNKVRIFNEKIDEVLNSGVRTENSINILNLENDMNEKITEFDWDVFFESAFNSLGLNRDDVSSRGYNVKVLLPSSLRKIIEVIKTTDTKTLAHFLISKTLIYMKSFPECDYLFKFYRPVLYTKIVHEELSTIDVKKKLESLKFFYENFKTIEKQLKEYPKWQAEAINLEFDSVISILSQNQSFANEMNDFYKQFEPISPENFYSNVMMLYSKREGIRLKGDLQLQSIGKRLGAFGYYLEDRYFADEFVVKGKPMLHHFVTSNYRAWNNLLVFGDIMGRATQLVTPECLYKMKANGNGFLLELLLPLKISLNEYFKYLTENKSFAQKQNKVLHEFGLSDESAWFLAVYQNICTGYSLWKDYAFDALKHSKEFSSAFGCKSDDPMYVNTCQLNEVTADHPIENLESFLEKIKVCRDL